MATTNITFDGVLSKMNQSLQIGDTAYYGILQNDTGGYGGAPQFRTSNSVFEIGTVKSILLDQENNKTVLLAEKPGYINPPPTNSFIFFSKDNVVNVSALKGYYGEMTFVNNSNEPAELYAVSCEVVESSK
jgi:hypothetical protein